MVIGLAREEGHGEGADAVAGASSREIRRLPPTNGCTVAAAAINGGAAMLGFPSIRRTPPEGH